jgi:dienelactone hydrolase
LWEEPDSAKERKLVIWLPGFTDGKESVREALRDLAAAGFVALSFDPVDHGERGHRSEREITDPSDGRFRNASDGRIYRHFWSTLAETAEEVPTIVDWAEATLGVAPAIGIGGKSMGGDIAVTAAGLESRIAVVAACIATADWLKPGSIYELSAPNSVIQAQYERYNPLTNLERYRRCPAISFQCSAADPIVPADGAVRFVDALAATYADCPERLEVAIEPGAEHRLSETMWRNALAWFTRYV